MVLPASDYGPKSESVLHLLCRTHGAGLGPEVIHAELGEVLAGKRSGRTDAAQITVFASVGLAFQDLAAGWLAYTLARQHGIGRSVDLLG